MKRYVCIWLLFCLVLVQKLYAHNFPDLNFTLLSTKNGLPTNQITSVFEDSRGLIWMGTESNGLLRYDGKSVKEFSNIKKLNGSAVFDYVGKICEDKNGWLWIGTDYGLYHFDPFSEKSIAYFHEEKNKTSLAGNDKPQPFVDARGRIWVSTTNGLQLFDEKKKIFISYETPSILNIRWQAEFNHIGNLFEDSKHQLWAASAYGIYLIDTLHSRLIPYYTGSLMWVTNIYEDSQNNLWVGFWGEGLRSFDQRSGKYSKVYSSNINIVFTPMEWKDENNKTWICFSNANAFVLLDPVSKKVKEFKPDDNNPKSIKGNSIFQLYKDSQGRIWIITNEGINILDNNLQRFFTHKIEQTYKNEIYGAGIPKSLIKNKDGYLFASWFRGSLLELSNDWQVKKVVDRVPTWSKSPNSMAINFIEKEDNGNIWFCTDSGLVKKTGEKYQCYVPGDFYPYEDEKYAARSILKRKDGIYWVSFRDRGLYIFNPVTGVFGKNYKKQYKGKLNILAFDNYEKLWLGTENGLYRFDQDLDSLIRFKISSPQKKEEEKYNYISQIYFDSSNTGWIGTNNGLIKITAGFNKIKFITDSSNGYDAGILRLLEDKKGIIWLVTLNNLIAYNKTSQKFTYFNEHNGLQDNFQGVYSILKFLDDSTVALGTSGTITTFNPYQLFSTASVPAVFFTDFSIDNNRIDIEKEEVIYIDPGAKLIEIHFAMIHYTAPQQNMLFYKLSSSNEGKWIESKNGDIIFYDLPAGKYTLQIKGSNDYDAINEQGNKLIIVVNPLWYHSNLFKILTIIVLAFCVYLFVKWRIQNLYASAQLKQHITETEMAALKAQMNPHFMFNCINSIDSFIQTNDKYNATLYLNKFAKLIRNVLDSSKQNVVSFSKDIETLRLYIELEELRSDNKFKTNLVISDELMDDDYKVPPLIIQPFVENAIIHGLKNREDNNGLLFINILKQNNRIYYVISDNGIGRRAASQIIQNKETHFGMQMSYDRIKLFNKEANPSVVVTDLYEGEKATGTKIEVYLNIV